METEGRRLHAQAVDAREQGSFEKSLELNDKALLEYEKSQDVTGFTEALANRGLTLRVIATEKGGSEQLLTLAQHELEAAVEIAHHHHKEEALALPLYQLAQVYETQNQLPLAVETYRKALAVMATHPPQRHNRPAVLADMQVHASVCEYKSGDKSAKERAEKALEDLTHAEEPNEYNKAVWVSGGHMRLALALRSDEPEKAKEHLQEAKKIIDAHPQLTLRSKQWQRLATSFS